MNEWKLRPGEFLSRDNRRIEYGGALYGGIEPSAQTPNVFVYSDPSRGEKNGYVYDGWNEDKSIYLYTGEGRIGDQKLSAGNKAIADHKKDNRKLRLFVADGIVPGTKNAKNQRYVGEFEVDATQPFYLADALDENQNEERVVFVFRLRPIGEVFQSDQDLSNQSEPERTSVADLVGVEKNETFSFEQSKSEATTSIRTESQLVERYTNYLVGRGHGVKRWRLLPTGSLKYLFTDVYDEKECELYEAKGSSNRNAVRLAIGQLLDYRRFVPVNEIRLTLLLPSEPSEDLKDLIRSCGMSCVWEFEPGRFERTN
jgi:5-methylcytosine-specific restriction protein A